jgi:hypothetical protein
MVEQNVLGNLTDYRIRKQERPSPGEALLLPHQVNSKIAEGRTQAVQTLLNFLGEAGLAKLPF